MGSPIALVLLGAALSLCAEEEENEIKNRLRVQRVRGEWFVAEAVRYEMRRLGSRLVAPEDVKPQETFNDSLNVNMNVRVSVEELAAWKAAARSAGMSLSQWARNVVNADASESEAGVREGAP